MPTEPAPARRPLWFRRRSLPLPTWRTWLVVLTTIALLLWWLLPRVHDWLAVVEPQPGAPYMIVEGWAPDYVLQQAADDADESPVKRIFTTGVPLETGTYLSKFQDFAHLCAASLAEMGVEQQLICPAPAAAVNTDRTRAMASALKKILDAENIPAGERRINLYTLGTHGRRSRRIFQDVLGSEWRVGVISVPCRAYDNAKWYRQSAGAKSVIEELTALLVQSTGGD